LRFSGRIRKTQHGNHNCRHQRGQHQLWHFEISLLQGNGGIDAPKPEGQFMCRRNQRNLWLSTLIR
jgi:hypothetical protein